MKENMLVAYAMDFASFLMARPSKEYRKINKIVLFGSVARGEAGEKSDIDIFIDTAEESAVAQDVENAKNDFYESAKFRKYWKLLGVENDIRCVVGSLEKWGSLKRSIISDGIVLYGKYAENIGAVRLFSIFVWGALKPEAKRVLFNKRMFGYKHKGKFYQGLLQKSGGEKLDNAVIVPAERASDALKLFRSMKIKVKIRNVNEY